MASGNFDELYGISDEVVDIGIDEATSAMQQEIRPTAEQVKQAARELVNYATILQAKNGSLAGQMSTLNTENEYAVLNFSKKMVKAENEFKELMERMLEFQNLANEFLGQQVIMTFVYISPTEGNVDLFNIDNSVEHLTVDRASKSHGGTYSGRYSTLSKLLKDARRITNSNYNETDKKTLDNTFQEVWQRYRISKSIIKSGGAAYILWKIGDWDGRWISGAGPLGEAYVNFFMNEYVFTNQIESAVADFMTNKAMGAELADNASGFLQGDVTKGSYEMGVKIQSATAMGYTEVIRYASELLQDGVDVEQFLLNLKEELREKGKRNMVKTLEEKTHKKLDKLMDEMEERLNEVGTNFGNGISIFNAGK